MTENKSSEVLKGVPTKRLHTSVDWYFGHYTASVSISSCDIKTILKHLSDGVTVINHSFKFRGCDTDPGNKPWSVNLRYELSNKHLSVTFARVRPPHAPNIEVFEGSATVTFNTLPAKSAKCQLGHSRNFNDICTLPAFEIPSEDFQIFFTVSYGNVCHDELTKPSVFLQGGDSELESAYEKLFLSGKDSDLSFVVGEEKIPAHKAIVVARVPLFDGMMSSGMKEAQTNSIEIKETDADSFKEVLKYIYCGKLPEKLEEQSFEILPLADKYDLKSLRDACIHCMDVCLTKENICDTLITADLFRCDDLKRKCLECLNQWRGSMDTQVLEQLKEKPDLMIELMKTN